MEPIPSQSADVQPFTSEQLESLGKVNDLLANTDFGKTITLQIKKAGEIAAAEGGSFRDHMADPRVQEISVNGNRVTFGFDTLLHDTVGLPRTSGK